MIIQRKTNWGVIKYDTSEHRFTYIQTDGINTIPYIRKPIVLNLDLTMKCNMACLHCVTKDFKKREDLRISEKIIEWINKSPFMVVVITGGEPFLPELERNLFILLKKIHNKGLIIDTNGTIAPSKLLIKAIRKTKTLVRVSWDSVRPQDEICLRRSNGSQSKNLQLYYNKLKRIKWLQSIGIFVAAQTVVHKININSLLEMPAALEKYKINRWYLQRLIPSHLISSGTTYKISDPSKYSKLIKKLTQECEKKGIECITKNDKRHNCVFLLVGNGLLYTQGEKPREKILLGKVKSSIKYFNYVSSSDHSERYYG